MPPRSRWLRLLFPLVLWGLATCYFGGDLGRWKDDYWFDFRDPVTGRADLSGLLHRQQFWRPIHCVAVPVLHASLAEHFWVVHLIGAAVHGAVCLALWRFLRSCGLGPVAAGLGGLVFLAYPGHWEVPLWPSATSTAVATGVFLCIALIWVRALQAEPGRQFRRLLIATPAMAVLAFVIACLNEQPTAGIPALPLLTLALRRPQDLMHRAVARSFVPAAACALAVVVYLALYFATSVPGTRGTAGTFVSDLPALRFKWALFVDQFRIYFLFQGFGQGALDLGVRTLTASLLTAGLWLGALIVSALPWVAWWRRPESPDASGGVERARVRLWLTAFGVAVFLLGWLPVLAIADQPVEPRLCYVPMVGLAIALAACVDAAGRVRLRAWVRRAGVAVLVALLLVGVVMQVGVQAGLRARARADDSQAAQLRELLPDPVPGSIFIPLRLSDNYTRTGTSFDSYFSGALERSWSSTKYLRRAYARRDVRAGWRYRRGWTPVVGAELRGLRYDEHNMHPDDQMRLGLPVDDSGATLIPWGRVVPFLVEEDGTVRLVSALAVFDAAQRRTVFPARQVARALGARGLSGTWAVYRDGVDPNAFEVQTAPVPAGGRPRP